jgi:hypothetical protein
VPDQPTWRPTRLEEERQMERPHDHEHGDYAKGQEEEHADGGHHDGSYAEGQAEEKERHGHDGSFAEGQESEHDESSAHREGSFSDRQAD